MKNILFLFILSFNSFLYSQTFDGNLGHNSLNWSENQKDFASPPRAGVNPMSVKLWDNYNGVGAPTNYGSLLEISGKVSHLVSQLYFDNTWNGARILYRSAFYAQDTWESWRYLLDSKSDVESAGNLKIVGQSNSYVLNGNFGIGTTNPVNKLEVTGNDLNTSEVAGFYNTAVYGDVNSKSETRINIGKIEGSNRQPMGAIGAFPAYNTDSSNGNLAFYTRESQSIIERIRINSNGNVGIGTTNPTSKLTVAGNIHAQEVKVTINAGLVPDYVFENDYKLKSLQEVEEYVKENSHLPEIPSAKEIEKNGLMLAEMNMSLLKKMEEMTLYMIELEKKNDKQILQIKTLQKQNEAFKNLDERLSEIEKKIK